MKKTIYFFTCFLFSMSYFAQAQQYEIEVIGLDWQAPERAAAIGVWVEDDRIYMRGNIDSVQNTDGAVLGVHGTGYYENGEWHAMGAGAKDHLNDRLKESVASFFTAWEMHDGKLYMTVPKNWDYMENVNYFVFWEDGDWHKIYTSDSTITGVGSSTLLNIIDYNDMLLLTGSFNHEFGLDSGSTTDAVLFNGNEFLPFDKPFPVGDHVGSFHYADGSYRGGIFQLADLTELFGETYISGNFSLDGFMDIAKWDFNEEQWVSIDTFGGLQASADVAVDLQVYKNKLYVSGWFFAGEGNQGNIVMAWDPITKTWDNLHGGLRGVQSFGMEVYNDLLFVYGKIQGSFTGINNNGCMVWDGEDWSACPIKTDFYHADTLFSRGFINEMRVFGESMYVSGGYTHINGEPARTIIKITAVEDTSTSISAVPQQTMPMYVIAPNPIVNQQLTIQPVKINQNEVTVEIYNTNGQQVYQQLHPINQNENLSIHLNNYPKGHYYTLIKDAEYQFKAQFVVE